MIVLSSIYFLVGICYVIYELTYVKKVKHIKMVSIFRLMYACIYGFLPAIILNRIENGTTSLHMILSKEEYFSNMSFMLIVSLMEYLVFNLFYKHTKESKYYYEKFDGFSPDLQKRSLSLILVFGIISLFLWTKVYGSVWEFAVHADAIRSGNSEIYNPFAFMEHFTKVFMIVFFISFSLFIYEKRKNIMKVYTLILLGVSLFFSLLVMLCTDSRVMIGILIIVSALYYFNEKILNINFNYKKAISRLVVVFFVAFITIVSSEGIMKEIRRVENKVVNEEESFVDIIEGEFGFTFTNQVVVINEIFENPFKFMIVNDVVGSIFAYIPSRFIPFDMPIDLWDYNSEKISSNYSHKIIGQSPADFVTASLYLFGWPGIVLLPAILGMIFKKIETSLNRKEYSPYLMAVYTRFMYSALWWVAYFSLQYTVLNMFGMVLVHLILFFGDKYTHQN